MIAITEIMDLSANLHNFAADDKLLLCNDIYCRFTSLVNLTSMRIGSHLYYNILYTIENANIKKYE